MMVELIPSEVERDELLPVWLTIVFVLIVFLLLTRGWRPKTRGTEMELDLWQSGETVEGKRRQFFIHGFTYLSAFVVFETVGIVLASALTQTGDDLKPLFVYMIVALFTLLVVIIGIKAVEQEYREPSFRVPPERL